MDNISPEPTLKNPKGLTIPLEGQAALRAMFTGYRRLVIEKQFGQEAIYLVHPIRHHNIGERPAIVKVAPVALIQQEWTAYQLCIQRRWPGWAWVSAPPIISPSNPWGVLPYALVGSGKFAIESLRNYARHAALTDLRFSLEERLADLMRRIGRLNQITPALTWQAAYDRVLPVNLRVSLRTLPAGRQIQVVSPAKPPERWLRPGDYVRLEGFAIHRQHPTQPTLLLDAPPSDGSRPGPAYRVQIQPNAPHHLALEPGHPLPPLDAVVIDTRYDILMAAAHQTLGTGIDLTASTLTIATGTRLPNPLLHLFAILGQSRRVKTGYIHGHFTLDNILVAPATREVGLIDFTAARPDHFLHDFFRLETDCLTHFMPQALAQANLSVEYICQLYEQLPASVSLAGKSLVGWSHAPALEKSILLLHSIRSMAQPHLSDQDDWTEYHSGLLIYLIGALTAPQLDRQARQVAFWAAAAAAQFING